MDFQVFVKIGKDEIKSLSVSTTSSEEFNKTTIKELKKKALSFVPGETDVSRMRIMLGTFELEDDNTLEFYKIEHTSLLNVKIRDDRYISSEDREDFLVRLYYVSSVMDTDPSEEFNRTTIRELKEKALGFFPGETDINRLRIIYDERSLEDNKTIEFYNLQPHSALLIILKKTVGAEKDLHVRIKIDKEEIKTLSVATSFTGFYRTTIKELKKKALGFFPGETDVKKLKVVIGKFQLEDNNTFELCMIEPMTLLNIMKISDDEDRTDFQVYVILFDGRTTNLPVATSSEEFNETTIKELKLKALSSCYSENDNDDKLIIIFSGRHLEDGKTLEFYRIEPTSKLFIIERKRGGGDLLRIPRTESMERIFLNM